LTTDIHKKGRSQYKCTVCVRMAVQVYTSRETTPYRCRSRGQYSKMKVHLEGAILVRMYIWGGNPRTNVHFEGTITVQVYIPRGRSPCRWTSCRAKSQYCCTSRGEDPHAGVHLVREKTQYGCTSRGEIPVQVCTSRGEDPRAGVYISRGRSPCRCVHLEKKLLVRLYISRGRSARRY
jgi:hypothetical protein